MNRALASNDLTCLDVQDAARRIAPLIHRTPVMTCSMIDRMAGRKLFFKCENLQKVGAFKFRGACNAVFKLPDDVALRGVVTHSSGNHAQALALAAHMRGIAAHVIMPRTSSAVKLRAVQDYGGTVYTCEPNQRAREETASQVAEKTGATFISSYNHPDVIAGQGTAALELIAEIDDLDAIIAPIGGGGLMAGTCIAAAGGGGASGASSLRSSGSSSLRSSDPAWGRRRVRLFGAEPAGADDAARSFQAGELIPQTSPDTIADGLRTSMGDLTWPIIRDHVERVFTVSDAQIIAAMRLVWERMKIIIELSSATVLAVALSDEFKALNDLQRVGLIISGGNVDLDQLPWIHASA